MNFKMKEGLVATSGCFDILHVGHIQLLKTMRAIGDKTIVFLNSDDSVAKLKGEGRPVITFEERKELLFATRYVDSIVVMSEVTPGFLIDYYKPQFWVKGSLSWTIDTVTEAKSVWVYGGTILITGQYDISTSGIIERCKKLCV